MLVSLFCACFVFVTFNLISRSYGSTIREKGIHAIPLFIFNGPQSNDGPFRSGREGAAVIISGSGKHGASTVCMTFGSVDDKCCFVR